MLTWLEGAQRLWQSGWPDFEPALSCSQGRRPTVETPVESRCLQGSYSFPFPLFSDVCTSVSASEPKTANKPAADPLAAFVASLTAEQRQRLASLLTGTQEGGE